MDSVIKWYYRSLKLFLFLLFIFYFLFFIFYFLFLGWAIAVFENATIGPCKTKAYIGISETLL